MASEKSVLASKKHPWLQGVRRENQNFVETPAGSLPIGPLWILVLCAMLFPFAAYGAVFWLAGAVLIRLAGSPSYVPKDGIFLRWLGRNMLRLFWLPNELYFKFRNPKLYATWQRSVRGMGKVASGAFRVAASRARKAMDVGDETSKPGSQHQE